ncbi:MAG: tetratricopeptide repeat protein [Anaerolineales bacterium]|nr:tetratricopeptide repeat protein [Anaerolineales bacterium]
MRNPKWFAPLIVSVLLAATLLPVAFTGYFSIKDGETEFASQNYASAADSFSRAARFFPWRNDLWERAGIAASAGGDALRAIAFLKHVPQLSEQGWLSLAFSFYSNGDTPSALEAYQQGLQFYDSPSLYAGLAFIYRQQKDWNSERDALMNQIRLGTNSGDVYAHYRLGLLLTFTENGQALSELMTTSSLNPEFDPAVQTMRSALNISAAQTDPSQQFVTIGRALGLVQEWDLSMEAFEKAIEFNAENAEAWAWLGEAKQQIGQDGGAELDQAVTLDHTSATIRALRGLYWNRQGKYAQMLAEYLLAAESESANPAWQAEIGNAYFKLGDLASALNAYQLAVDLAPNDVTYWRLLAVFCGDNNVHTEDVGLPAAQKAVELAPDDPLALDALGWLYLSSGRLANAEQVLLDIVERFPYHFPAHIHLAMTYLAQDNRTAAFAELTYVRDADMNGPEGAFAIQLLEKYFP